MCDSTLRFSACELWVGATTEDEEEEAVGQSQ